MGSRSQSSSAEAMQWKQRGNDAIQEKDFDAAVYCYGMALGDKSAMDDAFRSILHSNRAYAFLNQNQWMLAVADGLKGMNLNERNVKAIYRAALGYKGVGEINKAKEIVRMGLATTPGDENLSSLLQILRETDVSEEYVIDGYWATMNENTRNIAHDGAAYKTVSISGRGMGVVAIRDIKAGEIILEERPMLTMSDHDQNRFLAAEIRGYDSDDLIVDMPSWNKLSEDDQRKFYSLGDGRNIREKKLLGVFMTNCFGHGNTDIAGVCFEMSFFNHSCRPNVHHTWKDPAGRITTMRDIKKGEELFLAYVPEMQTTEQRQIQLEKDYGFLCKCEVCSLPTSERRESDKRRAKYKENLAKWEAARRSDPRRAFRTLKDLLEIYEQELGENYATNQICGLYMDAAGLAQQIGDAPASREMMLKAYNAVCIVEGADSDLARRMKQTMLPK